MKTATESKIGALAPWFGSNRSLAHVVGELLNGCSWAGVPFAGGMSELMHISAPTVLVSDLHAHVLNLASVVAEPQLNSLLQARLDALPVHPDVLTSAQKRCRDREKQADCNWFGADVTSEHVPDLDWAVDYFVCAWMSRNGCAGTWDEFRATQSVRWTGGGGDSATRFRNATESLAGWCEVMRRCTFVKSDVFQFLRRVEDRPGHALYLDPPFPEVGDGYKFQFDEGHQLQLARWLTTYTRCKIVCRFYDHPLIRKLYPESRWTWHRPVGGKTQTNEAAPEVLLVNRTQGDV